jgi:hypothetical protein
MRLDQKSQASLCDVSVFPLRNTILFRGIRTCESMKNAMSICKMLECCGDIFPSIVSLKLLNRAGE